MTCAHRHKAHLLRYFHRFSCVFSCCVRTFKSLNTHLPAAHNRLTKEITEAICWGSTNMQIAVIVKLHQWLLTPMRSQDNERIAMIIFFLQDLKIDMVLNKQKWTLKKRWYSGVRVFIYANHLNAWHFQSVVSMISQNNFDDFMGKISNKRKWFCSDLISIFFTLFAIW